MRAVDQWRAVEVNLPEGWEEARLSFTVEDSGAMAGAAAVLAPLGPGRSGNELRFHVGRSGVAGVESVRNLLRRLDEKRIWGTLGIVDARVAETARTPSRHRSLVTSWEEALRTLPPDWSDLFCELEVDSSDYVARAALLGAPLNPTRNPDRFALRFRASRGGYGAPMGLVRRCLEWMDEERITGRIMILNVLSETGHVATQGPVWRVAGRSV